MCSLVALVALANHMFSCSLVSLALVLVLHFLSCLCKVCSLVSDALLVALDTLMRFVAWSDKLYSAFLLLWNTCWQHLQFQL